MQEVPLEGPLLLLLEDHPLLQLRAHPQPRLNVAHPQLRRNEARLGLLLREVRDPRLPEAVHDLLLLAGVAGDPLAEVQRDLLLPQDPQLLSQP